MYSLLEEVWNENNQLKGITEKYQNYNLDKFNYNIEKFNNLENNNLKNIKRNLNNNLENSRIFNKSISCDAAINKILSCSKCQEILKEKMNINTIGSKINKLINNKFDNNSKEFTIMILFGLITILIIDLLFNSNK